MVPAARCSLLAGFLCLARKFESLAWLGSDDQTDMSKRSIFRNLLISKSKEIYQEKKESSSFSASFAAPISPSPADLVRAVYDTKVKLSEHDVVVDLGCGDGRWIITAVTGYNCRKGNHFLSSFMIQKRLRMTFHFPGKTEKRLGIDLYTYFIHHATINI
jgi:hypothetical protein